MRLIFKSFLVLLLMMAVSQSRAAGFEFRVAQETAEVSYLYKSSTFGKGGSDVTWSYLFNENKDKMVSASYLISGNGAGSKRALQFGVGVKAFAADIGGAADVQGGGLGIGGLLRYVFSSSTPVAILVEAYTVPKITSFGETNNFSETRFALELEVAPNARAYIGYKAVSFEDDTKAKYEVDDSTHVGVRLSY